MDSTITSIARPELTAAMILWLIVAGSVIRTGDLPLEFAKAFQVEQRDVGHLLGAYAKWCGALPLEQFMRLFGNLKETI